MKIWSETAKKKKKKKSKRKIGKNAIVGLFSIFTFTFQVHSDDVIITHKVPTRQQLRHFWAMGSGYVSYTVAGNAVRAQTKASGGINSEHILLKLYTQRRKVKTEGPLFYHGKIHGDMKLAITNFRTGYYNNY